MGHFYEKDGKIFPSVTTVLHVLGNDNLVKWANYMGFKHIDSTKYMEERANYGTLVHDILSHIITNSDEKYELGNIDKITAHKINKLLDAFQEKFPKDSYETIFSEKTLINEEFKYGGTLDWLCKYDNKTCLFDFKTSKNVYPYMPLQLAGYMGLLEMEEDIKIDMGGIILVSSDKTKLITFEKELLDNYFEAFKYLLNFYHIYGNKLSVLPEK